MRHADWCADRDAYPNCDRNGYAYAYGYGNRNGYSDPDAYGYLNPVMAIGQHFDALMAQPGPSSVPSSPPQAAGGLMSNSASENAIMTNPVQQARIRTQASFAALKRMTAKIAMGK